MKCKDSELQIQACYCMSHYSELNRTVVGTCLYSCTKDEWYDEAKDPPCEKYSRTGEMCSKCSNETGYPLYSYSLNCIKCDHSPTTVIKYLAVAFLPLTAFYVIVITFRISATGDYLSGYILASQILTTPYILRYITALHTSHHNQGVIKVAAALFAVWNLDFMKSIYTPFCYDKSTNILLVSSLDYIIALYPLGLILLTFFLVSLRDRYLVVARLWAPVQQLCQRTRHQWQVRKSLVDAFATFLLLSYIKILNASFDILLPATLHDINSTKIFSKQYLYYDGSQHIYHHGHTKYAVLAVVMSLVFNVAPFLLLLCYPCKIFHRLMNLCGPSRFKHFLHVFMDAFQGCYQTSPRDCRYFAAIGLLVRFANLIIFSFTLNRYYFPFATMLFMIMAGTVAVVRPYKSARQNSINAAMYSLFGFGYISTSAYALHSSKWYDHVLPLFVGLTCLTALGYVTVIVFRSMLMTSVVQSLRLHWCRGKEDGGNMRQDEELFESLRGERRPLLHRTMDIGLQTSGDK